MNTFNMTGFGANKSLDEPHSINLVLSAGNLTVGAALAAIVAAKAAPT